LHFVVSGAGEQRFFFYRKVAEAQRAAALRRGKFNQQMQTLRHCAFAVNIFDFNLAWIENMSYSRLDPLSCSISYNKQSCANHFLV
jgi:hypothetical protein